MTNAMEVSVTQYAELANMTIVEVLEAMQQGNQVIIESVLMLMSALA